MQVFKPVRATEKLGFYEAGGEEVPSTCASLPQVILLKPSSDGLFQNEAGLALEEEWEPWLEGPLAKRKKGIVVIMLSSPVCRWRRVGEGRGCGFVCVSVFSWKVYK